MRTPGERTSGAWTGGCAIHPDGGDETDRTAGNSYTATPHNTQGANSGQVLLQPYDLSNQDRADMAVYRCQECGGDITDQDKEQMFHTSIIFLNCFIPRPPIHLLLSFRLSVY